MVYTSGAVSIEHEGVARVFYSKQKPRVCTINHKPRHGTTVLQSRAGPYLGTDCARGYQIAARRYRISVKGRGRFSWGRRSHSCRCYIPVLKPSRMLCSSLIKLSYHPACC